MCLKDGKAPATANRHVTTLKHMFTKAVEWELEQRRPSRRSAA